MTAALAPHRFSVAAFVLLVGACIVLAAFDNGHESGLLMLPVAATAIGAGAYARSFWIIPLAFVPLALAPVFGEQDKYVGADPLPVLFLGALLVPVCLLGLTIGATAGTGRWRLGFLIGGGLLVLGLFAFAVLIYPFHHDVED